MGNVRSIGKMGALSTPDTFTYDALSRLTGATLRKSTTQIHATAYQYDAFGNLTGRAESAQGQASLYAFLTGTCGAGASEATDFAKNVGFTATVGSGANGPNNRLATVTRGGTLSVNGTNYATGITQTSAPLAYDGNGNVTDDGTFTYTYDAFNRQVAVRGKGARTPLVGQYFYDAAGERAGAIGYNASGTAITYTQYLRDRGQVVYEKTWTISGTTLTPQGDKTYITAGGKMALTRQTVSGTTTFTYYATDHLGTVRSTVTVNTGGTEQYRTFHDFEPFGLEIPVRDTVSPNTHRFTGHERDAETGNDYMHARYYGSNLGRFMKPDNIGGNMANPQSWNLYSYVHGNPVNFNDPTGHMGSSAGNSELGIPRSVSLDDYLWGGASVTSTVYNVYANGNYLMQVKNPGDLAKSTAAGKTLEQYLVSIGIPAAQAPMLALQLQNIAATPNKLHERLIAIVRKGETYSAVTHTVAGEVVQRTDVVNFNDILKKAGFSQVVAWGHQHMPVGTSYGALEGPSEFDRTQYGDTARERPTMNPNEMFVITEKNFYYFQPNPKVNVEFLSIPW